MLKKRNSKFFFSGFNKRLLILVYFDAQGNPYQRLETASESNEPSIRMDRAITRINQSVRRSFPVSTATRIEAMNPPPSVEQQQEIQEECV